ncbi:tRNA 2-selenouridine(34) synthase MnmH [Sanyastnella coralliicola]|uniref:tRNA 2-selenouridine(34) synthase MnmH n=1 Tax=Sanyastnella coralliicola TaxID=3069118 RepID=UPI0027B89A8D|nr:tRNA 2-selenouridine(34) synthase MnmH [Longitalea sp. SCSIO 12813]
MVISPQEFLNLELDSPILDVRTPAEFEEAHIPGAINLPIFDNNERALVGTVYKNHSPDQALKIGLDIVGPKMSSFVNSAQRLAPEGKVRVHCWRGGMRSNSMAWLLTTAGFQVDVLEGGYKAFRNEIRRAISNDFDFRVLGGFTGSAKTQVLHAMKEQGAQVIDLEGIAKHKGSSFGNLLEEEQPGTEAFIVEVWDVLRRLDANEVIWMEDESRTIGRVYVSDELLFQIKNSRLIFIERTMEQRAEFLAEDYGNIDPDLLKLGFERITKRLGGQNVQLALELIDQGDLAGAATIGLRYYDKTYSHGLSKREEEKVQTFDGKGMNPEETAKALLASNIWK